MKAADINAAIAADPMTEFAIRQACGGTRVVLIRGITPVRAGRWKYFEINDGRGWERHSAQIASQKIIPKDWATARKKSATYQAEVVRLVVSAGVNLATARDIAEEWAPRRGDDDRAKLYAWVRDDLQGCRSFGSSFEKARYIATRLGLTTAMAEALCIAAGVKL